MSSHSNDLCFCAIRVAVPNSMAKMKSDKQVSGRELFFIGRVLRSLLTKQDFFRLVLKRITVHEL